MSAFKQNEIELTQLNSTIAPRKQSNKFLQLLKRRIYIVNWIQEYDRSKFLADLIAGFTIGLMIIPQSLAYASLAEVPSQVIIEYCIFNEVCFLIRYFCILESSMDCIQHLWDL